MFPQSNMHLNLEKVKKMLEENPNTTHIYIKRIGMDNNTIDVQVSHIESTIMAHPEWEVLMSVQQMNREVEALFDDKKNSYDEVAKLEKQSSNVEESSKALFADDDIMVPPKPSEIKDKAYEKSDDSPAVRDGVDAPGGTKDTENKVDRRRTKGKRV